MSLALGRRGSDVHYLSVVVFSSYVARELDGSFSHYFTQAFGENPGSGLFYSPVVIKSLHLLVLEVLSFTLCPVKTLKCYLKRSHPVSSLAFWAASLALTHFPVLSAVLGAAFWKV